jgi:hypothetical protein
VTVLLFALGLAALHWLDCWWYPHERCPRCRGNPRDQSPTGVHWGYCSRCGGSGQRERLTVRVWRAWRRRGDA